MKKLSIVFALLGLCSALAPLAGAPAAPQSAPETTNLTWRPRLRLPKPESHYESASVAVDSEGAAHFAHMLLNTDANQYEIWYYNTRYDQRSDAKGFSQPELLDFAPNGTNNSVYEPDIWVDEEDTVHMVWIHVFYFDFSNYFNRIAYWKKTAGGQITTDYLTPPTNGHFYEKPQIVVNDNEVVHVIATFSDGPNERVSHIVRSNGTNSIGTLYQDPQRRPVFPRLALRNGKLAAAWQEFHFQGAQSGTDVYFATKADNGTAGGWSGKSPVTTETFTDRQVDVEVDESGALHFAWVRDMGSGGSHVFHKMQGGGESQVSTAPEAGEPGLDLGSGARVRVHDNEIHVFYAGFSHASKFKSSSNWRREQRLKIMGKKPDGTDLVTSAPMEVGTMRGRFDICNAAYYARTQQTLPDGLAWEPVFPNASVNLVPLNGSFQYRLPLFSTQGVGPCSSLTLTYNSKDAVASLVGPGWIMSNLMHITVPGDGENICLTLPNGLSLNFNWDSTEGYALAADSLGFVGSIKKVTAGWNLHLPGGTRFDFNSIGKLGTIMDPTGNRIDFTYSGAGLPLQMIDMLGNGGPGRVTQFHYGTGILARRVTGVTDPNGSQYELNYSAAFKGYQLTSVVFAGIPERPTYEFEYGINGMIKKVIPPLGFVSSPKYGYSVFYDGAGRVERVEDPAEAFLLDSEGDGTVPAVRTATLKVAYNDSTALIGPGKFHTRVENRRGFSTVHVFDAANNFSAIELWDTTALAGMPGIHPIRRTFDTFGNILTEEDRWGLTTVYTYYTNDAPAPWLRNLVKTIAKPDPLTGDPLLSESFTYTPDEFGLVENHTVYLTPTEGGGPVPRTISYQYDAGRVSTTTYPNVVRPDGVQQTAVTLVNVYQGPRRQLSRTVNEEGRITDYSDFHPAHGLARSTLREGGSQPFETQYDIMGNVTATRLPQGGQDNEIPGWTTHAFDGLYRVVSTTDPAGFVTTKTYDLESRLLALQRPAGAPTTTMFDRRGFVIGGSTPDGSWSQMVDAQGNIRHKTSLRGFSAYSDYDSLNRVIETRAPGASTIGAGSGGGGPTRVTRWTRDGFSGGERFTLETRVGAPADRVTKLIVDNRGRVVRAIQPDLDTVEETFYDEQDRELARQTRFGGALQTCRLTFRDARNRVDRVRVQDTAYGQAPARSSTTCTIYNKAGSVVQTVDPLGNPLDASPAHKTTYELDARERILRVVDGKGVVVTENVYGDDDLVIEVRAPDAETKSSSDRVLRERRVYTKRKELKSLKNFNNATVSNSYTAIQGQIDTATDAEGRITKTTYHPDTLRVDEIIEAQGTPNERRIKSVWTNGLLHETRVWNPVGGAYNAVHRQFYDQADRLERYEPPLGAAESYAYNAFGEQSQVQAGSKAVAYNYNSLGLRTQSVWSGAFSATETRTYNGSGLLESVSNGALTKVLLYDTWLGTPSLETLVVGASTWKVQSHVFDVAKNQTHFFDAQNGEHEWRYDENGRVSEVLYKPVGGSKLTVQTVTYTPGQLVDRATLNDAQGNAIAITRSSYDKLARRVRATTVRPGAQIVLADFEWEFNALDLVRKTKLHHLGTESEYVFNERRELERETISSNGGGQNPSPYVNQIGGSPSGPESMASEESQASPGEVLGVPGRTAIYAFDPGGNRTSQTIDGVTTTFTHNAASQLSDESAPGRAVSHLYDEWGNEITRTTTQGTVTTETFGYNYLNLASAYMNSSTGAAWQYDFWPTGERYSKTNLVTGASELYAMRGQDVSTEYDFPSGGQIGLKNTYLQGPGMDQKHTRIPSGGGGRRHYIGDQIGTVSLTLSDQGSPAEISLKDSWGVPLSGGTPSERYGFAQREHDQESGLVHMRARMYDPKLGRFNQIEPLQWKRSTSHYVYARNNPVMLIDPDGMDEEIVGYVYKIFGTTASGQKVSYVGETMQELEERFDGHAHEKLIKLKDTKVEKIPVYAKVDKLNRENVGHALRAAEQHIMDTAKFPPGTVSLNKRAGATAENMAEWTAKYAVRTGKPSIWKAAGTTLDDAVEKSLNAIPPKARGAFLKRLAGYGIPIAAGLWVWASSDKPADAAVVEGIKAAVPGGIIADVFELVGDGFKSALVDPINKADSARADFIKNYRERLAPRREAQEDVPPPQPPPMTEEERNAKEKDEAGHREAEKSRKRTEEMRKLRESQKEKS